MSPTSSHRPVDIYVPGCLPSAKALSCGVLTLPDRNIPLQTTANRQGSAEPSVGGTETSELPFAIVDGPVAMAPRVTLLELPGGHACRLEQMDRFLDAMEVHLTRNS